MTQQQALEALGWEFLPNSHGLCHPEVNHGRLFTDESTKGAVWTAQLIQQAIDDAVVKHNERCERVIVDIYPTGDVPSGISEKEADSLFFKAIYQAAKAIRELRREKR